MADSVQVTITKAVWVDITNAGVRDDAYVQNSCDQTLFYVESAAAPASTVRANHRMVPGSGFSYTLTLGQRIYVRTTNDDHDGLVTVTPRP